MQIKTYEDLEVYKLSIDYTKHIYKIINGFPSREKYNIADQMMRASSSIGANVAEGFGRNTTKEFVKYLYNARGSLLETRHFTYLSMELGYLTKSEFEKLKIENNALGIKLNNLINALNKKIN